MFAELPHQIVLFAVAAFLLGWILASISARMVARHSARKRDVRDDRIRSLEAEQRVAQTTALDLRNKIDAGASDLQSAKDEIARRDGVIEHLEGQIQKLTADLRDSVRKTRELREELRDRATENMRSEVKQRELETELSIAQASTDLIATGVLDYSFVEDEDDAEGTDAYPIEAAPRTGS
jgi:chromosome segregation ATPase